MALAGLILSLLIILILIINSIRRFIRDTFSSG